MKELQQAYKKLIADRDGLIEQVVEHLKTPGADGRAWGQLIRKTKDLTDQIAALEKVPGVVPAKRGRKKKGA